MPKVSLTSNRYFSRSIQTMTTRFHSLSLSRPVWTGPFNCRSQTSNKPFQRLQMSKGYSRARKWGSFSRMLPRLKRVKKMEWWTNKREWTRTHRLKMLSGNRSSASLIKTMTERFPWKNSSLGWERLPIKSYRKTSMLSSPLQFDEQHDEEG